VPPLGPVEVVPELLVLVPDVVVEELVLVDVELLGLVLVLVLEELVLLVGVVVLELVELELVGVLVVRLWLHCPLAIWATLEASVVRSLRRPGFTPCTEPAASVSTWLSFVTELHWPL
jgi:hypothetical protein